MNPVPELPNLTEFGLLVQEASGEKVPFKGFIEVELSSKILSRSVFDILFIVVSDTEN